MNDRPDAPPSPRPSAPTPPGRAQRRSLQRRLGYALVLAGFVVMLLLGYGAIGPSGSDLAGARTLGSLFAGLLPTVACAAGLFGLGVWLVKLGRRP